MPGNIGTLCVTYPGLEGSVFPLMLLLLHHSWNNPELTPSKHTAILNKYAKDSAHDQDVAFGAWLFT